MKQFCSGLFLSLLVFLCQETVAQERKHLNFDDNWKFAYGNASDAVKDFNYGINALFSKSGKANETAIEASFNDKNWRSLSLPHDWAVELPFMYSPNFDVESHGYKPVGAAYPETSIGWYRKHFKIAKPAAGQRVQIQFDGVFRDANFWINGFYLGNTKSGYLGSAFDITNYLNLNPEKENILVVRVDATQYEGWFYEGAGIYRHVWLNHYNNVHLAENPVFVHTSIKDKTATINVETSVDNESLQASSATVYALIKDRNGKVVAQTPEQKVSFAINESKTVKQSVTLKNPTLWSLENPYLYKVEPVVKIGDKVVDSQITRFGIRTIDITDKGVFLNGQFVKIKGTNNHQDHAGVGSALPDYLQYYRIEQLKEFGSNAYRASHHAPTPELLDACDSLGMLVLDENRLLNSSPQYVKDFENLLKRDRSRASVFLWSIGNEEGYVQGNNTGKLIAETLLAKQRELDPTRLTTYAADMANVFKGVNEVVPVRGFNYRQFAVADYHKDHPTQPIIGTEMGSTVTTRGQYEKDTVIGYVPDQDITAPWWASKAETWWQLAAPNDFWLGGFIWTGFDYRGEPTPYKWPNINSHFGMMDVCGFPKNIYYYYQSWWTDKDVLHLSPHWNWAGKEGQPIDVWVNTNAENVELFLNDKSLGKKEMPRNGHLQWAVPYEAGVLKAVAQKKGKQLTTQVQTTSVPYKVVISPSKTTVLADGKDATVFNISVVDKAGLEVPTANTLISFKLAGDAQIIGVGNGDPSSHEADKCEEGRWQRRLFNGKCQVILQSGKTAQKLSFEANANGIEGAKIEVIQH